MKSAGLRRWLEVGVEPTQVRRSAPLVNQFRSSHATEPAHMNVVKGAFKPVDQYARL